MGMAPGGRHLGRAAGVVVRRRAQAVVGYGEYNQRALLQLLGRTGAESAARR